MQVILKEKITVNNNFKKGGISVETAHIFPIIKKWLYSEKDIFLREIVSNAQDAITKLKRLSSLGQYESNDEAYRITVTLDKDASTLTVEDNGIGMTAEELEKYICQIALSGALDFIQKYEGEGESAKNGIIGHFGLGFYSAFMVSDTVELETRSFNGAPAVHWTCSDAGEYEISEGSRNGHGTTVVMHITDSEDEYLDENRIKGMLEKYCSFMPVEIYFKNANAAHEHSCECDECKNAENPINDPIPLWTKSASECTDEEYKEFYHKVFSDFKDPLFWIHINADYPLNFKGILFFPRFKNEYEPIEGQVKLYYNQVFVADNIKEVIPDYLLMLKGVLDCPELPLNVSRSYLQSNNYVAKLSAHIVKKVADKLNYLKNTDRAAYETVWNDVKTFIEYACMRDRKFYERVKDSILLKTTANEYITLDEYLESAKATNEGIVYYATDRALQIQYVNMYESEGIKVALLESTIDTQFAAMLEQFRGGVKFVRIDADIASALKGEGDIDNKDELKKLFEDACQNSSLSISFEAIKGSSVPAILNVSEESRRMDEMMRLYAIAENKDHSSLPLDTTLIINTSSPVITKLSALSQSNHDRALRAASYVYKLALLSYRHFSAEEMNEFLAVSYDILESLQ